MHWDASRVGNSHASECSRHFEAECRMVAWICDSSNSRALIWLGVMSVASRGLASLGAGWGMVARIWAIEICALLDRDKRN